ncbi:septum formation initiator family protein [Woeseiaceae bacterium]|nr:septum formation initiator family protein [Woeseiaceae bacterium]
MQIKIWVSEDGYQQMSVLQNSVDTQIKNNIFLEDRNKALEVEIRDLKIGTEAIEERARKDLGLIGKDEIMYIIIDQN